MSKDPKLSRIPPAPAANGAGMNPFADQPASRSKGVTRGGANQYGFASIETFCDQSPLSLTHDDAQGFYDYVKRFAAPNFWYRDSGVAPWLYYEDYDNWQDTYGADAVKVFYHSGHGGMGGDGNFFLPMGADWGGLGCTVYSSNMRLGNEHLRYAFWSTCNSLRVFGGQSPNKTWNAANLGLRMIFGYETTSVDHAGYGKFFFEEWNKNKSLSQAFLDASWRISHNQTATVTACGATQQEAQNRLFNERFFEWGAVSKNWWWWRWMGPAAVRDAMTSAPMHMQHAILGPAALSADALSDRFELGGASGDDGSARFEAGEKSMTRSADGSFSVRLAAPNLDNPYPISLSAARSAADRMIGQLALASGETLIVDRIIQAQSAGGTAGGSGEMADARTDETIVQYRQTIDGVPVISPGAGTLRIALDNDGKATRVEGSLRSVGELSGKGVQSAPQRPAPDGRASHSHAEEGPEPQLPHEAALARLAARKMRSIMARGGNAPAGVSVVPGSTEIGYAVKDDAAHLVAAREIEIDFGNGYKKRYQLETLLFG